MYKRIGSKFHISMVLSRANKRNNLYTMAKSHKMKENLYHQIKNNTVGIKSCAIKDKERNPATPRCYKSSLLKPSPGLSTFPDRTSV